MPIQNENQRQIRQGWLEKFEYALKHFDEHAAESEVHPLLRQAQRDGIHSQIEVMRSDLLAYDNDQQEKMNEA